MRTCACCYGAKQGVEAEFVRLTPLSRRVTRWMACPWCSGKGKVTGKVRNEQRKALDR